MDLYDFCSECDSSRLVKMDQQSSNANMPRDTVETLKQIQKQGFSISIVKSSSAPFSLPSVGCENNWIIGCEKASAENRPKQNMLPGDNTAKITSLIPQSQATTENKRSNAETRVSSECVTTKATFHDSKAVANQPAVPESKGFSPSWSGPNYSAEKSQETTTHPIVTTPVSKMQTSQTWTLVPDNKTAVNRSNQSMLSENKNHVLVTPGQRFPQNQQLIKDMSPEASPVTPVSTGIATLKRSSVFSSIPVKKECVKRAAPGASEMSSKSLDESNLNSSEEGNENETQFFNNLKTSRTGLTTRVPSSVSLMPSSSANAVGVVRMPGDFIDKDAYHLACWEKAQITESSKGRRKYIEPVCLTLSSDDEEEHMQVQFNNFKEAFVHQAQFFPQESEGESKSGQSSPVYQDVSEPECDDPEFPGVTNIPCPRSPENTFPGSEDEEGEERKMDEMEEEEKSMGEKEEEEMEENELKEEELGPLKEEDEPLSKRPIESVSGLHDPLPCRSVRIGSFKVHPKPTSRTVNVYLAMDGISFNAPMVSDPNKIVNITLKPSDITKMFVHFSKCLPIVFVFTTPSFAQTLRNSLDMSEIIYGYYDPTSNDERQKKITFLIDYVNDEQRQFLRYSFLNDERVRELNQNKANEILVRSTPGPNKIRVVSKKNVNILVPVPLPC